MGTRAAFQWISLLASASLTFTGCSQSAAPPAPAAQSSSSKPESQKYDVKVTSGASRITRTEKTRAEATDPLSSTLPAASRQNAPPVPGGANPLPTTAFALDDAPVGELTMPQVALTQAHQKNCKVQVGDQFPDLKLADLQGRKQPFGSLLGKKLTVVAFWNGRQPTAREELADLGPRIAARFSASGVAVVGINSGDDPQLARELASQAGAQFANLSDSNGAGLAQVGTGKIPRTYLLDSTGKIVWMDLEYSRTTRRDLNQAIRFLLAN